MIPRRRVYVAGVGQSTFLGRGHPDWKSRRAQAEGAANPSLDEHLSDAVLDLFESTGVDPAEVERGYVANFLGELFCKHGHLGSSLAGVHPGLDGKSFARIEAACASGSAAIIAAAESLQAGHDVALVAGVEVETNVRGRDGVDYLGRATHPSMAADIEPNTFPHLFARRAKACKDAHGWTDRDVAAVSLKAFEMAKGNPRAQMQRAGLDEDTFTQVCDANPEFLQDPELRGHMRLLESTTFTDGAAAVLLVTDEGLERLGLSRDGCTELLAWGHSTAPLRDEADPVRMSNMRRAAAEAYEGASVGPGDVAVAEVHDCFAITELLLYEALGFADEGGGAALLRSGDTRRDGRLPVNAGGGLLGTGHPVGATGVRQAVDLHRQLSGTAEGYQVGARGVGITANLGGDDRTGIVGVWRGV